jgi:hypothetical protein
MQKAALRFQRAGEATPAYKSAFGIHVKVTLYYGANIVMSGYSMEATQPGRLGRAGRYVPQPGGFSAFIPAPLPPAPPLTFTHLNCKHCFHRPIAPSVDWTDLSRRCPTRTCSS